MTIIEFSQVSKSYPGKEAVLKDFDFTVSPGEFVTLVGPSGCGKTTVLRLINGLLSPDQGRVSVYGKPLEEWDLVALRRKIGYVVQQIDLFPHLKVEENVGYVLALQGVASDRRQRRVRELMKLIGLGEGYLSRYPRELSGGQKQRVGVARALAADPEIILMDEPFGAVDEITRSVLQREVKVLQKRLAKTIVFVTHDIEEAFFLGSRIVLFGEKGGLQDGSKWDMAFSPNDVIRKFFGGKSFGAFLAATTVREVMMPVSASHMADGYSLGPDTMLLDAVLALSRSGGRQLTVVEDGRAVGIFDLAALNAGEAIGYKG